MNYIFFRRIRGPIYLLTFGVTALLAQWDILGFSKSWPLYLIVAGVLRLVEGATLAAADPTPIYAPQGYGTPGYAPQPFGAAPHPAAAAAPGTGLSTIPPAPIAPATGYTVVAEEDR